ncbi:hypothetical protein BCR39DRAFT_556776 [Naematelia encephala]|uniref:Uncharacterized protein n=1 Tax=Naematelia encephala TaxID=71784 RepID=A0A1Y2BGS8_9TREE|nr:hypothetical protein BCR39DRAFT_556776 [Naematelia encephala]
MFAQSRRILSTAAPVARNMVARRAAHTAPVHEGPITKFFRDVPMPVEAYPLAALTVTMCSFAGYHAYKHIHEDRDHIRWLPGMGNVQYVQPRQ